MNILLLIRRLSLSSTRTHQCLFTHYVDFYELACLPQDGRTQRTYSGSRMNSDSLSNQRAIGVLHTQTSSSSPKRSCLSLSPELRSQITALVRSNPCALNSPLSEPRPSQVWHMQQLAPDASVSEQFPIASHDDLLHSSSLSPGSGIASSRRPRHWRRRRPRREQRASGACPLTAPGHNSVATSDESFGLEQLFAGALYHWYSHMYVESLLF